MPVSPPLTSDQFDGRFMRRNENGDDVRYCEDGAARSPMCARTSLLDCGGLLLP